MKTNTGSQSRKKAFATLSILGAVIFFLAVSVSFSIIVLHRSSKAVEFENEKKDFQMLQNAFVSFVEERSLAIEQARNDFQIFPRRLSELVLASYIKDSNFIECERSEDYDCDIASLYYKSKPILYFRTPLARSNCPFVIDDQERFHSAVAVIIFQGPVFLSNPFSNEFYRTLRTMIEEPAENEIDLDQIKEFYQENRNRINEDDMIFVYSADDAAESYRQRLIMNSVAFSQKYYSRFRTQLMKYLEIESADTEAAMLKLLSDREQLEFVCSRLLKTTFSINESVDSDVVYFGDCYGVRSYTSAEVDHDLTDFSLQYLSGDYVCIRAQCVVVSDDEQLTRALSDPDLEWPLYNEQPNFANRRFVSIDLRIEPAFERIDPSAEDVCPRKL